jgi:hypothetical protein
MKTVLTDNQRRAMPHAIVDSVIPQQRPTHKLQIRLHSRLPQIESLGTLDGAELRKGTIVRRRTQPVLGGRDRRGGGTTNKRITGLLKVWAQKRRRSRNAHCHWDTPVSVALMLGWTRRGVSWHGHCPASDERILHRLDLRDGAEKAIGTSGRGRGNL